MLSTLNLNSFILFSLNLFISISKYENAPSLDKYSLDFKILHIFISLSALFPIELRSDDN